MHIIDRGENHPEGEFRYELHNKDGKHIDSSDTLHFIQMMYGPKLPVVTEEKK